MALKKIIRFLKTNPVLVGTALLVIPLIALLWFQYVWLCRLEQTSAIAEEVSINHYLDVLTKEVTAFYRTKSDKLLKIPHEFLEETDNTKIAEYWKKANREGVRRLYLVDYKQLKTGSFSTLDTSKTKLVSTLSTNESLAVILACLPWQTRVRDAEPTLSTDFHINEHDTNHRLILNPIIDKNNQVVAITVMVLDEAYFKEKLLKTTTLKVLGSLFEDKDTSEFQLVIRDEENKLIYGTPKEANSVPSASKKFTFVFKDWTLSLYNKGPTPEQWARNSFFSNMALAVLLIALVIGGLALALRSASRAMKLSQMKSDFVSNVSHELRTPLASIRVFAEFLRTGKVKDSVKIEEYGELIEIETTRLTRLIDNILDFSKIESEKKIYKFEPTNIKTVVDSVLKTFSLRLNKSGFNLIRDIPEDELPSLNVDPDAMGQALHNLIDNGIKYSEDVKEITVKLKTEDSFFVIAVGDRGMGISNEEQGRIFDRFHRVGTSLVHDIKGSGLGLAIVYHIMRAHGGTVEVSSEPGKGSIFKLRLPLHEES